MNTSIIISSANNTSTDKSRAVVKFPIQQTFKNQEIGLSLGIIPYSWWSISPQYKNQTVSYIWTDGTQIDITFPTGFFSVAELNNYIHSRMKFYGHYLTTDAGEDVFFINISINAVYYAIQIDCTATPVALPTGWYNPGILLDGYVPQLIINNAEWGKLVGFSLGSYPATFNTTSNYLVRSDKVPQICPVVSLTLTCNLANSTGYNVSPNVIRVMIPQIGVTFGSQIIDSMPVISFFPINDGVYDSIEIGFQDQSFRPVYVNDSDSIILQLMIRERRGIRN